MTDEPPILHLYSPYAWHTEAYIVGTRSGLAVLHAALGRLLAGEGPELPDTTLFVNDGEGFDLQILLETEAGMESYAVPYTADYARAEDDTEENPHWPKRDAEREEAEHEEATAARYDRLPAAERPHVGTVFWDGEDYVYSDPSTAVHILENRHEPHA